MGALLLVLAACTGTPAPQPPQVNRPNVPAPGADSSVVTGQILGTTTKAPIKQTPVYLAQIYWDTDHKNAAFALDLARSPVTRTDDNGFFTITDIKPAEYALIIGDFYGRNEAVRESNGNARIYKPEAGKTIDVGTLEVAPDLQVQAQ